MHMKKNQFLFFLFLFALSITTNISCGKDDKEVLIEESRQKNIAGTWKMKDITLAYPIPADVFGVELPVGFSVFNVTSMLPLSGPKLDCTKNTEYIFNSNYSYSINGCYDLIFPDAGESGNWSLSLNGGIIQLGGKPYMTTAMTKNTWSISNTVFILEAGAAVPVNIILEK